MTNVILASSSAVILLSAIAISITYFRMCRELGSRHPAPITWLWVGFCLLFLSIGISEALFLHGLFGRSISWAIIARPITAIYMVLVAIHLHFCLRIIREYNSPSDVEKRCRAAGEEAARRTREELNAASQ